MLAQDARDTWLLELEVRGSSARTVSTYRACTDEALALLSAHYKSKDGKLELDQIRREGIVAALSGYKLRPDGRSGKTVERSGGSVLTFYRSMRAFLAWCVLTDKLPGNEAVKVTPPKAPGRVPKALSLAECAALLDAAKKSRQPERDTLAVRMALGMGLRLSELSGIKLGDFVPSAAAPTHLSVRGKGDKERMVPVPSTVAAALTAYLPLRKLQLGEGVEDAVFLSGVSGKPATSATLGQIFDSLVRKAGVKSKGVRVHAARHSFATHALSSGACDLMDVKELLGHSSVATTQVYLKVDPARLSKGVETNPMANL